MRKSIERVIDMAQDAMSKAGDVDNDTELTVYYTGMAQFYLMGAVLTEISKLNDNLDKISPQE